MPKKFCHKCGSVHEYGECPNKKDSPINISPSEKKKSHYKTYAEMNEEELKIQKFYNSKEWRKMRDKMMAKCNGLCQICWALGKLKNATSVHHIVKLRVDFNKRLDEDNLICVCDSCHRVLEESCSSVEEVELLIEKLKKEKENK